MRGGGERRAQGQFLVDQDDLHGVLRVPVDDDRGEQVGAGRLLLAAEVDQQQDECVLRATQLEPAGRLRVDDGEYSGKYGLGATTTNPMSGMSRQSISYRPSCDSVSRKRWASGKPTRPMGSVRSTCVTFDVSVVAVM